MKWSNGLTVQISLIMNTTDKYTLYCESLGLNADEELTKRTPWAVIRMWYKREQEAARREFETLIN